MKGHPEKEKQSKTQTPKRQKRKKETPKFALKFDLQTAYVWVTGTPGWLDLLTKRGINNKTDMKQVAQK